MAAILSQRTLIIYDGESQAQDQLDRSTLFLRAINTYYCCIRSIQVYYYHKRGRATSHKHQEGNPEECCQFGSLVTTAFSIQISKHANRKFS